MALINRALNSFTCYLYKPVDGHSLAVFRFLFGFLMFIDLQVERSFHKADQRWSDPNECRFPLFQFIRPLPGPFMCLLYLAMTFGAAGMTLGYKFRISSTIYTLIYWYIFFLDKSYWNNHTYLFGLISMMLIFSDANANWSLDSWLSGRENVSIPFWQYFIIRFQISLVYFLAGVKKANIEWIGGYSMRYLSSHWVFSPFRLLLSADMVDLLVVHWGGFVIDSFVGIFLLFQSTRPLGYLLTGLFNSMNSQMFSIGMFPYVMLAVLPIYSSPDWPVALSNCLRSSSSAPQKLNNQHINGEASKKLTKKEEISKHQSKQSTNSEIKSSKKVNKQSNSDLGGKMADNKNGVTRVTPKQRTAVTLPDNKEKKVSCRQRLTCLTLITYMLLQLTLPFSHNLTQGYNTWTQGVYGYSWDMMVHNWRLLGKRVLIVDKKSGQSGYLNVEKYSPNNRWTHHADMAKQFVSCVAQYLRKTTNLTDFAIHLDVWISLNKRFAQRIFDPRIDILSAEWSPWKKSSWVMPLINEFTDWRSTLTETEESILNSNQSLYVVFMADFPGLEFINYVDAQFGNTTLKVLHGWVKLEVKGEPYRLMSTGDEAKLPSGQFHSVTVIKSTPASYMYTFTNRTAAAERMWQHDITEKEKIDDNKKELWLIRYIKKWIRSFEIVWESLDTISRQIIESIKERELIVIGTRNYGY